MKALKCLAVSVAVVGLLAVSALAAHSPNVTTVQAEQKALHGAGGARDLGNDCTTVEDIGTLPMGYTMTPYNVDGFDDSFDEDTTGACDDPCGWYFDDYDGILTFQVAVTGTWTISACDTLYDNSIQLRANDPCPGVDCIAQDDDSCGGTCNPPYAAEIAGITLTAGVDYYLIVDTGEGNLEFSGPCDDDPQCDDGVFCNGVETCDGGFCVAGTNPCAVYQYCDEDLGVCVDPDPCLVWLEERDSGYFFRPGQGIPIADDWFLDNMCTNNGLQYYDAAVYGHPAIPGAECTLFNVEMELWTNTTDKICTGDWTTACTVQADCDAGPGGDCVTDYYPGAPIANTYCSYAGLPPGGYMVPCTPSAPVDCPVSVDPGYVPDAWVVLWFSDDSGVADGCCGPYIAGAEPPVIGWSDNVWALGDGAGGWGLIWFGGDPPANFVGDMCCDVCGPCCEEDGTCAMVAEADCTTGTYYGDATFYNGLACGGVEACCFGDDTCLDADAFCCIDMGGTPMGPGTACGGMGACCIGPVCVMADALCCTEILGGDAVGGPCEGDTDGDGVDGSCGDECPLDPDKQLPGVCGCGYEDVDTDGDGYEDCIDCAPGVDDDVYCPGCEWPDCGTAIPTVSEWGLVILALLLLAAGKVYFGRRQTC